MELYKIRANKKKFCELAERLGVNIGNRKYVMFRRFERTGDYCLDYVLKLKKHQLYLTSTPGRVTLLHLMFDYDESGIESRNRKYIDVPIALLRELGMLEEVKE